MIEIIGVAFGFWLVYALIASFSKHEIGLIVTFVLGIVAGFSAFVAKGDYMTLLGTIVAGISITFITSIQIKSETKNESRREIVDRNNENKQQENSYTICPTCGFQIFDDEDKCSNCGHEKNTKANYIKKVTSCEPITLGNSFFERNKSYWLPEYKNYLKEVVDNQIKEVFYEQPNGMFDNISTNNILVSSIEHIVHTPTNLKDEIITNFFNTKNQDLGFCDINRDIIQKYIDIAFENIANKEDFTINDLLSDEIKELFENSKDGDKVAQFELSKHYAYGIEIEKNREKQRYWLNESAKNGYGEALYELAEFYSLRHTSEFEKATCSFYVKALEYSDIRASIKLNAVNYSMFNPMDFNNYEFYNIDNQELESLIKSVEIYQGTCDNFYKKVITEFPKANFKEKHYGFMKNIRIGGMKFRQPYVQPYLFNTLDEYIDHIKTFYNLKEVELENHNGYGYTVSNPIVYQFVYDLDVLGFYINLIQPNTKSSWVLLDYRRISSCENNVDKYVVTYFDALNIKAKTFVLYFWMYGTSFCFPFNYKIYKLPKGLRPQINEKISLFNGYPKECLSKQKNLYGDKVYYQYILNLIEKEKRRRNNV